MKHCKNCNLDVRGDKERCPLCNLVLSGEPSESHYFATTIKEEKKKTWHAIVATASVCICVICMWINYIFNNNFWSFYVVAGICSGEWLLWNFLRKYKNLPNLIVTETTISIMLFIIWDLFTGWGKWSLNYAMPYVLALTVLSLFILGITMKTNNYIYILKIVVLSIVILILLLCGVITIKLPSIICIGMNVMVCLTQLFFYKSETSNEMKKRLHL